MKLTQIGISNFRSIGAEFVTIDLTKKLNVLVGANNCGKSNVLRALERTTPDNFFMPFYDGDWHMLDRSLEGITQVSGSVPSANNNPDQSVEFDVKTKFASGAFGIVETSWDQVTPGEINRVSMAIKGQPLPGYHAPDQIRAFAHGLAEEVVRTRVVQALPRPKLIPQFREITKGSHYSLKGAGIVDLVAEWDRPVGVHQRDRKKLDTLKALLRDLLEDRSVDLRGTHDKSQIVIVANGLELPLESLGTGIHELIILAIAVLQHDNALICIEEPEIHLHPLLQRRFLEFLRSDATTNRYVLTTHSPALIAPGDDVAVTHLWLENGVTKSRRIATTGHSLEALRDLGAKASDLLQANSVIWVEGPSDRIYLNGWLQLLHPDLREGIDYAVMFYGGRLLSYLSAERDDPIDADDTTTPEDTDDLIQLLRINQYSAIVIDSDRRAADAAINATKQRVAAECKKSGIPCWIIAGREIENCLPTSAVTAAFSAIAGQSLPAVSLPPFAAIETALETAFSAAWPRASYYEKQKPQRARIIARHLTAESVSPEVRTWIDRLARTIRHQPPS